MTSDIWFQVERELGIPEVKSHLSLPIHSCATLACKLKYVICSNHLKLTRTVSLCRYMKPLWVWYKKKNKKNWVQPSLSMFRDGGTLKYTQRNWCIFRYSQKDSCREVSTMTETKKNSLSRWTVNVPTNIYLKFVALFTDLLVWTRKMFRDCHWQQEIKLFLTFWMYFTFSALCTGLVHLYYCCWKLLKVNPHPDAHLWSEGLPRVRKRRERKCLRKKRVIRTPLETVRGL